MNKLKIEIGMAKEIVAKMENNISHFKTFISSTEKHLLEASVVPPAVPIEENATPKPDFYTIKTLAAELNVSERTVRRYCNEGLIRYMHIRGRIRFSSKDVDTFYRDHYKEKF